MPSRATVMPIFSYTSSSPQLEVTYLNELYANHFLDRKIMALGIETKSERFNTGFVATPPLV